MHIEKMRIKNYRRFRDTEISFSEKLTILAGANNSGKTSLVHLLDCIFGNRCTLSSKDVSLLSQSNITMKLFDLFATFFKGASFKDVSQFKENILSIFFDKKTGQLLINEGYISIELTVGYKADENISIFAQYLMDLDENKRKFYFEVVQDVYPPAFKRNLELNAESLWNYFKRYLDAVNKQSKLQPESTEYVKADMQIQKSKQLLIEKLLDFSATVCRLFTDIQMRHSNYIKRWKKEIFRTYSIIAIFPLTGS